MFNLRYITRLVSAFISRFKILILISIFLGILFFIALKFLIPIFSDNETAKIGITGRYTISTLPNTILEKIGDGLTKLDKNGSVEPNLAESWETSDKGKTWIFKLKKDLVWQNGEKVKSSDITYSFSDVTISYPDNNTIVFKLQNPYSAFPSVVSKPTFKKGLLGTGEWEVKKLSLSGSFVNQINLQNKIGDKIQYKFYPTEEGNKLAFEMGEVNKLDDIIDPTPFSTWQKIKINKNINTGEYVIIFFNTQDKLLSEKNIRQALTYAINKPDTHTRAISPISKDSWAYNSQVKPYDYDLQKAKNIIDDYKKSAKINDLVIKLSTSPLLLSVSEKIVKDWEAVGVKVNLQVISNVPNDYQALLVIFDIPEDPDQYSIWHSTQTATNFSKYQNPRIDKLLEEGRNEIDSGDRKRTYLDFQRFLVEDSPAAFLYYPTTYTISRK